MQKAKTCAHYRDLLNESLDVANDQISGVHVQRTNACPRLKLHLR